MAETTLHEVVETAPREVAGTAHHIQEEEEAVLLIEEAAGEEATLVVTTLRGRLILMAAPAGEAEEEEETQEVAVDHLSRTMDSGLRLLTVTYLLRLKRN